MIEDIMKYNAQFVSEKKYEKYLTSKYPDKKIAVLTCMDTRLTELLPAALGFRNGDVKIIKNAGGSVSHPFGSAVRSLLVAIYELGVKDIMVIGHTDCGVQYLDSDKILHKMYDRGVSKENIDLLQYCGINFKTWLGGFQNVEDSVLETIHIIKTHPLIPDDIGVYGFIMDSSTGELMPCPNPDKTGVIVK